MTIVETFAVIVAEAVDMDIIFEPFEVGFAHIAHLGVGMIPVATGTVVGFVTIAVVISTGG